MLNSKIAQHPVSAILSAVRWRQGLAILFVKLDHFGDGLTEFCKDGLLVVPIATVIEQSGAIPDEALVFVRPLNDLGVASAVFHPRDYSITALTALS
jgi:hypothetical protein